MSVIIDDIDPNYPMETVLGEGRVATVDACAVCCNPTAFLCTFCHGIFYCTDGHSAQDEVHHALVCRAGAVIPKRPTNPGRNFIAILVFPEHSPQPYYAWTSYDLNIHGRPVFDQSMWFGDGYRSIPRFITQHPVTRQPLGNAIMYFQRDHSVGTGSEQGESCDVNLCVHNFTGGKNTGCFKGPLLFLAVARNTELSKEWLLSFLPADLPLLQYELSKPQKDGVPASHTASIKGIVCYPDDPARHFNAADTKGKEVVKVDENQKITIEDIDIPIDHPIMDMDNEHVLEPTLAEAYFFPIRTYNIPGYRGLRGNTLAASLFPTTEVIKDDSEDPDDFGRPIVTSTAIRPDNIGAVLIARRDCKPLEISHVLRFVEFSTHLADIWSRYGEWKTRKTSEKKGRQPAAAQETARDMDMEPITPEDCAIMDEMYESLEGDAFAEFWEQNATEGDEGPFKDMEKRGRNFHIEVDASNIVDVDADGSVSSDTTEESDD
ncbi:hypothetical protein TWF696_006951 [Orbilia brochopaga]|uniref:MYND-type domain-containing protein n=1 Tax=Orbilia brochopaga TaxID=3140254 RepID=A0AAV9UU06_9PEZI